MNVEASGFVSPTVDAALVGAQSYASAILNILEDSADETARLVDTQRAVLNILDDFAGERQRVEATQSALLNILDDANDEKLQLADTQRAVLNILDDFDAERTNAELANIELRREISERQRAETALQRAKAATEAANRELEAFSYSVAHDLRAPLRSIDGFSQALLEDFSDGLGDEAKTYLRHVRNSAQHMARLITDLLSLSRVSRAELGRTPVNLTTVTRGIIERLRRNDPHRTVEFVAPPEVPALADGALLAILLENLVGNAWKFTSKHSTARIELGWGEEGGQPVYFVRDDGAGFDMAYQAKLFSVFQRLHSVGDFDGTGIGLATCSRVIQRHGGRIWAEGAVEQGATFFFTLEDG